MYFFLNFQAILRLRHRRPLQTRRHPMLGPWRNHRHGSNHLLQIRKIFNGSSTSQKYSPLASSPACPLHGLCDRMCDRLQRQGKDERKEESIRSRKCNEKAKIFLNQKKSIQNPNLESTKKNQNKIMNQKISAMKKDDDHLKINVLLAYVR